MDARIALLHEVRHAVEVEEDTKEEEVEDEVGEPMDLIDVETGANQTPEVEGIGRRVSL
jgi:hypothetical protein